VGTILVFIRKPLYLLFFLVPAVIALGGPSRTESWKIFDEDGDHIFENLHARMQSAGASEKIPVIIQYRDSYKAAGTYLARVKSIVSEGAVKFAYRNIPMVAVSLTPAQIEIIRKDSWIDHLELDAKTKACMDTAKASFGVNKLKAQFGLTGDGDGIIGNYSKNDIVIAIADTGVEPEHPDLKGKILYWKDFSGQRQAPYDDNGHGTHVAGVALGAGKLNPQLAGVAPQAALVAFKVLDIGGSGDISNAIAAIDEAIARKQEFNIRILNLSFAVEGSSNGRDALSMACNRAVSNGIVVIAAAGNDGPDTRTIGTPAAASSVITVGAGADLGEKGFYLADFSSRGPTTDGRIKPDLWGPGVQIRSPRVRFGVGGYSSVSGTSFAAPFVSGVVALMLDSNAGLNPGKIKSILKNTAARWQSGGQNNDSGAGRLQAYQAAVRAATITAHVRPPIIPEIKSLTASIAPFEVQTIQFNLISTRFPIAITLIYSNHPAANLELEVITPSGSIFHQPDSKERQETLAFKPTATGTYNIRVISLQGSSPYVVTISADMLQ